MDDVYNEGSAELMDLLAMLYFIVEVHRSDETFGDELSQLIAYLCTSADSGQWQWKHPYLFYSFPFLQD
jgi:hypothetical protein